jgi:hypothetical protein
MFDKGSSAMRRGILGAVAVLLVGSGLALGQEDFSRGPRVWVDAEYLLWSLSDAPVPGPLVTTGPLLSVPQLASGVLGNYGTQILQGNSPISQGSYSGARLRVGGWLNCCQTLALEGSAFLLPKQTTQFGNSSDVFGNPLLARPAVDTRSGDTVLFVSAPGAFATPGTAGGIVFTSSTEFWGAEANGLWAVRRDDIQDNRDPAVLVALLGGFRYLNLHEEFDANQTTRVLQNGVAFFNDQPIIAPGLLNIMDGVQTRNNFYGGQVGMRLGFQWWLFTFNATGKIAGGDMRQEVGITGTTRLDLPGKSSVSLPGGFYALRSNIGDYNRDRFAFVPEGTFSVAISLTSQINVWAGYTVLYVSSVVRPGDQINLSINRTELPTSLSYTPSTLGTPRPRFDFSGTDFWAQGLNVGLELKF